MERNDREYHFYGPWLLEIKEELDIPQQYLEHESEISQAIFAFKVPIQAVRRNLKPGQLMYHQVVLIEQDHLKFFTFDGTIKTVLINYKDIIYLTHSGELLQSGITFVTKNEAIKLEYNAVSPEITTYILNYVRDKITQQSLNTMKQNDHLQFHNYQIYEYFRKKEKPKKKPLIVAYQQFKQLGSPLPFSLPFYIEKYISKKLNDVMILYNGAEVIILDRLKRIQNYQDINYAYSHTFIPYHNINGFKYDSTTKIPGIKGLKLHIKNTKISLYVEENFSDTELKRIVNLITI